MRVLAVLAIINALAALGADLPFAEDFEKTEAGKLPGGFTAYAGAFKVNEEMGRKFLELPGAPLDTFGVLFGPALPVLKSGDAGTVASAKILATSVKRKAPAFGISLGGVGGYRVQVSAAKGLLEIFKGDEPRAKAPFQWTSGSWTTVKVQLRPTDHQWVVEGKAWASESPEPTAWTVTHETSESTPSGKAAVWGNPFSGTPIGYDDLAVASVAASQP